MKKRYIGLILLLIIVLLIIGYIFYSQNKYSKYEFKYKRNGIEFTAVLLNNTIPAMEWLSTNTPKEAIITAWWDYGHMIRYYGKREAIVFTPSKEILNTTFYAFTGKYDYRRGKLTDHDYIKKVAIVLSTNSPQEANDIMKSFGSEYLLVHVADYNFGNTILGTANKPINWIQPCSNQIGIEYDLKNASAEELKNICFNNKDSMMYKMLTLKEIPGFQKVYSDSDVVIYKLLP